MRLPYALEKPMAARVPLPLEEYPEYQRASAAIELMEHYGREDAPFLLRLDFFGPHYPHYLPEPYASLYDPAAIGEWANFDDSLEKVHEGARWLKQRWGVPDWETCAEIAAAYPGRLTVLHGDALEIDPLALLTPPIRIAANLPYNVGTELLIRWLTPPEWPPFWQSLTLMFQKEVAQRIVARPGSKAYGRLALLAQWRADAQIVMTLPPEAFVPAPKVHSAVVQLTALPQPRFPADPAILSQVTAAAFNQRRKMLRAALRGLHPAIEGLLERADIAPTARAEEIDLDHFCALARLLAETRG